MDLDPTLVATVATVGLGILAGSGGIVAYKYRQLKATLKEAAEFLIAASDTIEDDNASAEELALCAKEWREFVSAVRALFTL
ncbi:MAG: hypothetical protein PHP59_08250 [Methanofollis sp.]|uniref:hypothetical protein n=1 Tax=Methanofollis sp. TaxID=2052835 RepID=UPI0026308AE7|nr:hypothetical protein [Methanofollis sp.]MDD4255351.1 hypothetical protein [Methanofollis sp.]